MPDRPILVTGAAGFIGSTLAQALLQHGGPVIGIDNLNDYYDPSRKQANLEPFKNDAGFSFYRADIRDAQVISDIFARHRPQAVAHLAAYGGVHYSIGRMQLYHDVNLAGSINVIEAALAHEVEMFVFASTSSVYGNTTQLPFVETDPCNQPLAPYPATKKAVEVLGHSYHNLHAFNFTVLRFFSVYGPRGRPDMMPYRVTDAIVRGEPVTLFDAGQMRRDWTYVDDVVAGIIAALETPLGYQIINLGRGEPVLMADFVGLIEQLVGSKACLQTMPAPASEPKITCADISKARQLLDYNPKTTVGDGLARLWDWYRRHACPQASSA